MNYSISLLFRLSLASAILLTASVLYAQTPETKTPPVAPAKTPVKSQAALIGGPEHEAEILGVRVGMTVPAALEAVFVNAKRKPGQERPDAKRNEGKDNKDVRVLYKDLEAGELQIVFAQGQYVKEVILTYKKTKTADDLKLAQSGSIDVQGIRDSVDGIVEQGGIYDDRYTIGYTNDRKEQKLWWRDEKTSQDYRVRVRFMTAKFAPGTTTIANKTITAKIVSITPGDEAKFAQAFSK